VQQIKPSIGLFTWALLEPLFTLFKPHVNIIYPCNVKKSPIPVNLCSVAVLKNCVSVGTGRRLLNRWRSSRQRLLNSILFCTICTCCHSDSLYNKQHQLHSLSTGLHVITYLCRYCSVPVCLVLRV